MKKRLFTFFAILMSAGVLLAQNDKKPLDFSVYDDWKYIQDKAISDDGKFIFYEKNPYKGDGEIILWNGGNNKKSFPRGKDAAFLPGDKFLVFSIYPQHDSLRQLKLDKTPKDKLPKDSLAIYNLVNGEINKFEQVKSYKTPEKEGEWLAFWQYPIKDESDTTKKEEKEKTFDKSAPKTGTLHIMNPADGEHLTYEKVSEYSISKYGDYIAFVKLQNDSLLKSTVCVFDTKEGSMQTLMNKEGLTEKLSLANESPYLAFIHSEDTIKTKVYSLYLQDIKNQEYKKLVDTTTSIFPEKWTVSEKGNIYFSKEDTRLFFGVAERPLPEPKDSLLDEEKVKVDLWSWHDPMLQPQQKKQAREVENRTYLSYYDMQEEKLIQLADKKVYEITTAMDGESEWALAYNYDPYYHLISWDYPYYMDIYKVHVPTGKRSLLKKKTQARVRISAEGKYAYWYDKTDSSFKAYNFEDEQQLNLSQDISQPLYDVEHDYPSDPSPYGIGGWTKDDRAVLIYDEYDIWKVDLKDLASERLTKGRENNKTFRYIRLDWEEDYIDPKATDLLSAFDNETKQDGFYSINLKKGALQKLVMEDASFGYPRKAKEAEKLLWTRESFQEYPDLHISNLDFKNATKISHANPQQDNYLWGDVELVEWVTTEGTVEEGLLYKPENFDPNKKYPMMVYFYRLYSDQLHSHYIPKPSRSIINPSFYVSNDYLVFIPNIRYKEGYPGESAYNYIISGTLSLINRHDFVDKDHIGIQGQSWGGYQAAFVITKTDMFAAASAGAPVSNMTSAYGGIRWGSGMSRMFQYEKTQSRIGGTLWEKPLHYIENSPVFYAPKVNTPLLMRHNDGDGAVPWYQGIEYFVALRRLGKPVWMLNYNGAPHNEAYRSPNSKDLSIRMFQFFNHYLKGEPAPRWMTEGIPAWEKGKTFKYELTE